MNVISMTQKISTNEVKDAEQRKALNAWAGQKYTGTIIAGTGFGKSRCGVMAVKHVLAAGGRAIVLVPTVQLQDQFAEEFRKWEAEHCLDHTEIVCYQSAHKYKDEHYDIVVCDEVHLGLSPVYREFFMNNTYDRILCMTATPPEEEEYRKLLGELAPTAYRITLDQCVALGLVAPYKIYCVPVELSEEEKTEYNKANRMFVHAKYLLGGFDAFKNAQAILGGKLDGDKAAAAKFYAAIRKRKTVVQHALSKLEVARTVVDHHAGEKILTFAGSNDFTDRMAEALDGEAYHSKLTKKNKEYALQCFSNGECRVLCSTKALNQGFNVPDVGIGIIAGLDSKSLPMIQRLGRLLRKSEDKVGKVYILYVKDSQEQKWLESAVKTLNNVNINVNLNTLFHGT